VQPGLYTMCPDPLKTPTQTATTMILNRGHFNREKEDRITSMISTQKKVVGTLKVLKPVLKKNLGQRLLLRE
jgi:hypothetical protein